MMGTVTGPRLSIRARGNPPMIELLREAGVSEDFWLRLRAEFGPPTLTDAGRIAVPVDSFMALRELLRAVCQQYRVGVDVDLPTRALLARANSEQQSLRGILDNHPTISGQEVRDRLAGSRFIRDLRDFQIRDLGRLLALPHGANFSVPGAGKTTVAYATYEAERHAGRVSRLLVVAPLSAFESWTTEAAVCLDPAPAVTRFDGRNGMSTEVLLMNYQRLAGHYRTVADWVAAEPTHVVLDEAHRMKKGRAGQWGRAALDLSFSAIRRDLLSGTPAPQGPLDLEALLDFLWPAQAHLLIPQDAKVANPPADLGARIADRIRPLFVRTKKSELGLKDPDYRVVRIPLEGLHREIYMALRDQYSGNRVLGRRDRASLAAMGRITMYLLEAATNPALLVAGSSKYDAIEFQHPPVEIPEGSPIRALLADYRSYETPRKFLELAQIVRDNSEAGRKTLIWSNFVRNLLTLERMLARYQPALVHGGVPSEVTNPGAERTREREVARFRSDAACMVLLANPAATSEGISLHDVCHDAVYLDRTFNAGQYLQSVDRIHRLGLHPDAHTRITFLLMDDTIDELVDSRVRVKSRNLGEMLDDPDIVTMALPDEEDYGPALDSEEDFVALFAHLRGAQVRTV
jgi:hypothetical protein